MGNIISLFTENSQVYSVLVTIVAIGLIILSMYNRIKYLCLEKAAQKVAEVEANEGLSGSEKFAMVVLWINEELPGIFRNSFFKTIIEKLVQYAYDNSKDYAANYIKRKTGYDISELIGNCTNASTGSSNSSNSDSSTSN